MEIVKIEEKITFKSDSFSMDKFIGTFGWQGPADRCPSSI